MDKLKYIKLENEDGSYSSSIPLAVDGDHVDIKGSTLTNTLSTLATKTDTNNLQNQINSLASGSPKGVYTDAEAIKTTNPETGVYISTSNGHIYSWTKNQSGDPIDLGVYQAASDHDDVVRNSNELLDGRTGRYGDTYEKIGDHIKAIESALNHSPDNNNLYNGILFNGYYSAGVWRDDENYRTTDFIDVNNANSIWFCRWINRIIIDTESVSYIYFFDENKNYLSRKSGSEIRSEGREKAECLIVENAKYVRYMFSLKIYDSFADTPIQITLNEKPSVYEPYKKGEYYIDLTKSNVSKIGNDVIITTAKARYTFRHVISSSINVDMWRLYQGDLLKDDEVFANMWTNSDAEGAIKIQGEEDFVCGFHGDEILTDIKFLIDGELIDLTNNFSERKFKNITIVCKSNVYHCNTSEKANVLAFERVKKLVFTEDKVNISNHYLVKDNFTIERAAIALFQCLKTDVNNNELLNYINSNTDLELREVLSTGGTLPTRSNKTTEGFMYTTDGVIDFKIIRGQDNSTYNPYFADYTSQNRIKIYFDTHLNQAVTTNDEVISEFEWTIK